MSMPLTRLSFLTLGMRVVYRQACLTDNTDLFPSRIWMHRSSRYPNLHHPQPATVVDSAMNAKVQKDPMTRCAWATLAAAQVPTDDRLYAVGPAASACTREVTFLARFRTIWHAFLVSLTTALLPRPTSLGDHVPVLTDRPFDLLFVGVCDSATLTCAPVPEPPARQERLRVELTKAAAAAAKNIKKEKVKKPSVNKPLPAVQRQRQQQQQRQRAKPQFRVEAQLPQQPIAQYVPPSYDYAAANARLEDEEHDEELDEELDEDDEWNPEIATVTGLRQCPTGFTLCPVASRRPNSNGPDNSVDWACFDTTSSVTQCGGCSLPHPDVPDHLSNGEDCLQPSHDGDELASGVMSAACVESRCRVCESLDRDFVPTARLTIAGLSSLSLAVSCGANFIFDRATGLCRPARRDGKR